MRSDLHDSLAARLRWAREQSGLSQGQVAKLLGVHRPTISNIEAGSRSVKSDELVFFAETYEVNEDWLLHGEEAIPEDEKSRMVARELSKLSDEDLNVVLRVVRTLHRHEGKQ